MVTLRLLARHRRRLGAPAKDDKGALAVLAQKEAPEEDPAAQRT